MLYNVLSWYNAQESEMRGGREGGREGGSKLKAAMGLLKGFRPVSDHPRGQVGDRFFETDLSKLKLMLFVRIMERGHR